MLSLRAAWDFPLERSRSESHLGTYLRRDVENTGTDSRDLKLQVFLNHDCK